VPQLGDYLSRFRPAGAPGAAARAGVPADRAAEASAELAPVLARLAETESECNRIVAQAHVQALGITDGARAEAAAIRASGKQRAQAARAKAADAVIVAARAEAAEITRAAAELAASRAGPADEDIQNLIRTAVRMVQSMPDSEPGEDVTP
jgi:F0F1-type ATP synthase membrane subunit b/b'